MDTHSMIYLIYAANFKLMFVIFDQIIDTGDSKVAKDMDISISNLSCLTQKDEFLLQVSGKSSNITKFIKNEIPTKERTWLTDFKSWKIKIKWLLKISELCLNDYDQVFFDCGEELLDLNDSENYQSFREKIIEELM